ncbi:GTP cyclohydrolase II [Paenibacillus endophyticus]|uniref:GTP cyclohydrolase II n=1 Tax=Paenibacillus endophyticus TaxID=1294268 RepID=A0A7W5CCD9_9BACL|nr:GTP cyclohydrolase II [Paenibacillus endophyticus]MBB3155105.1 GTP cyclohydrolase II [Paenibacillus endophyticus]
MQTEAVSIVDHKIKVIESEKGIIYLVGPIQLPVKLGEGEALFDWYCWLNCKEKLDDLEQIVQKLSASNLAEMQQSSVLVYGDFEQAEEAWIRMHSICHTGDIFGSKRCDCGYQLHESMRMIAEKGAGALFYLANHEGRGIGLFSKAMAYLLQEQGYDTVEANVELGFADDARNYGDAIRVLKALRAKPVALITNNPKKLDALQAAGLDVTDRIPLWGDRSEHNERYLDTKINRSGHLAASGCPNE